MNRKNMTTKMGLAMLILMSTSNVMAQETVFACNSTGAQYAAFDPGSEICMMATGLQGDAYYLIWVQASSMSNGTVLNLTEDPTGIIEIVHTDANGSCSPVLVWESCDAAGSYTIVLDSGEKFGIYDEDDHNCSFAVASSTTSTSSTTTHRGGGGGTYPPGWFKASASGPAETPTVSPAIATPTPTAPPGPTPVTENTTLSAETENATAKSMKMSSTRRTMPGYTAVSAVAMLTIVWLLAITRSRRR